MTVIDSITIPCACCAKTGLCGVDFNSSGGDEGYSETFQVEPTESGFKIQIEFTAFGQEDRLIIGPGLYDSGCIGESGGGPRGVKAVVTIPPKTSSVKVTVVPNCNGGEGTLWNLSISCIK